VEISDLTWKLVAVNEWQARYNWVRTTRDLGQETKSGGKGFEKEGKGRFFERVRERVAHLSNGRLHFLEHAHFFVFFHILLISLKK
jgi:hypothetical protein